MLINDRIRGYRKELGLSQEYVARLLDVPRTTITAIEAGERSIKADEIMFFSNIFGVSSDELLHGKVPSEMNVQMFARTFSSLSESDKKEIINLIEFKKRMKEQG